MSITKIGDGVWVDPDSVQLVVETEGGVDLNLAVGVQGISRYVQGVRAEDVARAVNGSQLDPIGTLNEIAESCQRALELGEYGRDTIETLLWYATDGKRGRLHR